MLTHPRKKTEKGFTLFVAIVTMGTILLVAAGIVNLAVKQAVISRVSRESQKALYAANSGLECALYWDVSNPSGVSAFSTSTFTSYIKCNDQVMASPVGGPTGSSTFEFAIVEDGACTIVQVFKDLLGGTTTIESFGYNTCVEDDPRRVERAVRATY